MLSLSFSQDPTCQLAEWGHRVVLRITHLSAHFTHTTNVRGEFREVLVLKSQNKFKSELLFVGRSRKCMLLYSCVCCYFCFSYLSSPLESSGLCVLFVCVLFFVGHISRGWWVVEVMLQKVCQIYM